MIARIRASTATAAKGGTIIYNNMRREREKKIHSRQFGKNGFGRVLDLGLLTSLEGTRYMHKSFLYSRDLIYIPEIMRRGIEVDNVIVSRNRGFFRGKYGSPDYGEEFTTRHSLNTARKIKADRPEHIALRINLPESNPDPTEVVMVGEGASASISIYGARNMDGSRGKRALQDMQSVGGSILGHILVFL